MRTQKGHTKTLIDRLLLAGVSKWKIAYGIGLNHGKGVSFWNVTQWQRGCYEAHEKNLRILQDFYYKICTEQGFNFFSPAENKELDNNQETCKFSGKFSS